MKVALCSDSRAENKFSTHMTIGLTNFIITSLVRFHLSFKFH